MTKKVLIVDDEENLISLVLATLGYSERYDVSVAHDGRQALDAALQQRPDLVILDMLMPMLDGCAVCRALKQNPLTAHAKVIMLTAMAQQADRQKALIAGVDDFITKPFSPTALLKKVDQMIGAI